MLLGATVFGYVVASVSAMVTDISSSAAREKVFMNRLIFYCDEKSVTPWTRFVVPQWLNRIPCNQVIPSLVKQMKNFLHTILSREGMHNEKEFYNMMPQTLRNKVGWLNCKYLYPAELIPGTARLDRHLTPEE